MVAKVISGREVAEKILTTDLKNKVIDLNKHGLSVHVSNHRCACLCTKALLFVFLLTRYYLVSFLD